MTIRMTAGRSTHERQKHLLSAIVVLLSLYAFGFSLLEGAERDLFGDPLPRGATARAGTVRSAGDVPDGFALPSSVRGVVFSPDGKLLATRGAPSDPSAPRIIRIWDATSGKLTQALTAFERPMTALAFSADGRLIISATAEHPRGTQVWEIATGKLLTSIPGGRGQFHISPDGQTLSVADRFQKNDVIRTFAMTTGNEVGRAVVDVSHRFEFSPGGGKLISQKSDRATLLRLLEINSGKELGRLAGLKSTPGILAFSADGRTVAAAVNNRVDRNKNEPLIVLWELATQQMVFELAGHTGRVLALRFSPDDRYLISGGVDKTVRIWEVATGKEVHLFRGHGKPISAVAVSPDGTQIASGSLDRTALIWDFSPAKRSTLPESPLDEESASLIWIQLASASPARAYRAIGILRNNSDVAAEFLKGQIESIVRPVQTERIRALIADLEHEDFVVRFRATQELTKLREVARPILLKVIKETTSAEARYRIRRILTGADDAPRFSSADVRRIARVIHVLGYLPGKEAEAALEAIIDDFPTEEIVREARETLARLRRTAKSRGGVPTDPPDATGGL